MLRGYDQTAAAAAAANGKKQILSQKKEVDYIYKTLALLKKRLALRCQQAPEYSVIQLGIAGGKVFPPQQIDSLNVFTKCFVQLCLQHEKPPAQMSCMAGLGGRLPTKQHSRRRRLQRREVAVCGCVETIVLRHTSIATVALAHLIIPHVYLCATGQRDQRTHADHAPQRHTTHPANTLELFSDGSGGSGGSAAAARV